MIKWYISKFDSWINKQTEGLDQSEENVGKATLKEFWVLYKIINSPIFLLFMLPLVVLFGPFLILASLLEVVFIILLISSGVAFAISLYMILSGQGTAPLAVLCLCSGFAFMGYAIGVPLVRRSSWYIGKKKAFDRKLRSWLPF